MPKLLINLSEENWKLGMSRPNVGEQIVDVLSYLFDDEAKNSEVDERRIGAVSDGCSAY